jgi:hypothetical protein
VVEADQLILEHLQDLEDQVVEETAVIEDSQEYFLKLELLTQVQEEVQMKIL